MRELISLFETEGMPIGWIPFGSGHINETWLVATNRSHLYILQKVNTQIFRNPEGLMRNILLVTEHLRKKDPDPRHVLTLVPLKDSRLYIHEDQDTLWRMYTYVTGGICLEHAETPADFRRSGEAFGIFQRQMADFPGDRLVETIPKFHDTPSRYGAFHAALAEDRKDRAKKIRREIDFLLEREERAGCLMELQRDGVLPLRVTMLNNVIVDEKTREPLCILDLDTVMPGLAATDFGDSIRFGASTAAEDEPDTEKVHLDLALYRAYAEGFLGVCGDSLKKEERETLPDGAWVITLETAVRFLTDYLQGDTYFHTERPDHNLDRCRTQLKLVAEMEKEEDQIRRMIREI